LAKNHTNNSIFHHTREIAETNSAQSKSMQYGENAPSFSS
jgi:hypothetical protein